MKKKYDFLTDKERRNQFDGYYVYVHKQNEKIVYIGKGSRQRAISSDKREYNIAKDNIEVEIVARFDNSQEAQMLERKLINLHKPKYNKYNVEHKKTKDEEINENYKKMFKFMI